MLSDGIIKQLESIYNKNINDITRMDVMDFFKREYNDRYPSEPYKVISYLAEVQAYIVIDEIEKHKHNI